MTGGIGTYALLMSRALAAEGHDVHLITGAHPGLGATLPAAPGVHVHPVEPPTGPAQFLQPDQVRHSHQVFRMVRRLSAEAPFDVIEFPEYDGEGYFCLQARRTRGELAHTLLAVRLHTPSMDVRALDGDRRLSFDLACIDHLESSAIAWADLVLSPTAAMLARVRARQPVPRAEISPHPLDADFERAARAGRSEGEEVLYVGRLERRKGVELLLEAALPLLERRPWMTLRLIGGDTRTGPGLGSMQAHLENLVPVTLRPRVVFEGEVHRDGLPRAVRGATVCCFPSLWENFPNTCLEAMAAGAAVVASDGSGMAEIIEDGRSGLLFRCGDRRSLQDALARVLEERDLRERLGSAATSRVQALCSPAAAAGRLAEVVRGAAPSIPRRRPGSPSIAVVVPVFEAGALLDEALASVRAQTRPPDEIIVVDDGSTGEETLAAVRRAELAGCTVLRQRNAGPGAARNAALRAARSVCIVPLDADDVLAPEFLEHASDAWLNAGERSVVTALVSWFSDAPERARGAWFPWGAARDVMLYRNVASTVTALIPRALLDEVGGYDEGIEAYEDWDLYCRLLLAGVDVQVLPRFLFHYRQRSGSRTRVSAEPARERLVATMIARYPGLPERADRTLRLFLSEAAAASGELRLREEHPPVRYRLADAVNSALKKVPGLHRGARRFLRRLSD